MAPLILYNSSPWPSTSSRSVRVVSEAYRMVPIAGVRLVKRVGLPNAHLDVGGGACVPGELVIPGLSGENVSMVSEGVQPVTAVVGLDLANCGAITTSTSREESQCSPTEVAIKGAPA